MRRLWEAIQDNDSLVDKRDGQLLFLQQIADVFKDRFDFKIGQFERNQDSTILPFAEIEKYEGQRFDVVIKDIETQLTSLVMVLKRNGVKMTYSHTNKDNVIGRTLSSIRIYPITCNKRDQSLNIILTAMFSVSYDKRNNEPMRCSIVNINCNNLNFRKMLV